MPRESAAVGYSEKLTKEFFSMLFLLKMKPENDSGKCGNESMGPSHKEVGTNTTMCSAQSISKKKKKKREKKMLHRSHTAERSVWAEINVYRGVHRVTDFEKNVQFESRLVQG